MNKLKLSLILSFLYIPAFSQQNSAYQNDLQSLYNALQQTPSYKDQITGKKKQEYELLYEQLRTAKINKTSFDSLFKLSTLLWPIKDNHLGFYEKPNQDFKSAMLADTNFIRKFLESPGFKRYPIPIINIDSLAKALALKPLNSLEGIYDQGKFKIGIYADTEEKRFNGVILSANSPLWQRGEMAMFLSQIDAVNYRGVYANLYTKDLVFIKNDKFNTGRIFNFGSKKESPQPLGQINYKNPLLEFKSINSNIQYLRLGNFRTSSEALVLSQSFYTQIKDSLTAKNLIVDLRNNPGGGFKASGKFLFLLKRYSQKGNIYVLINSRTVSNAEQFTLKLKEYDHVVTFGETTMGMITYGSNYGKTETLPSGKYMLYPTDMRDSGNFLPYEEIGVKPDNLLDQKSDWIKQLIAHINQVK